MKHILLIILGSLLFGACKEAVPPTNADGFLLERERAEFRGIYLDKEVVIIENDSTIKNLSGKVLSGGNPNEFYTEFPVGIILSWNNGRQFLGIQLYPVRFYARDGNKDSSFNQLKKLCTLGKKPKRNEQWSIFRENPNGINLNYLYGNGDIEIIDVREVPTEKITIASGYHPKTLWVTYKIKVNFENSDSIDGTLKVRYSIYW
ncbi:hypothetical protein [Emticicia agri]|uniref:Lipoprotein n=1 Tax=Emticicia agri TaxID=2492393 RepID=A0A4Q5LWB7_9BACT|nr:hypothetical protein [Emticicia agri]RYU93885.1 hypothetical protein EWM59_19795 [Emticicia agri]